MAVRRSIGGFRRHRGGGGRFGRIAERLLSLGLGAAAVALLALFLRLERGPIVLDGAAPRLAEMAEAALREGAGPALTVALGEARLDVGRGPAPAPGLYLADVRIGGADGRTIAAAPLVRIGFRPLDLLMGRLRLTSVTVRGAALRLSRTEAGPPVGDLAPFAAGRGDAPGALEAVLDAVLHDPPPLLEALRLVAFEDADIVVPDGRSGGDLAFHGASGRVTRDGTGLSASGRLPAPGGKGTLGFSAGYGPDRRLRAELTASGATLSDLAALDPALAPLAGLPLALEAQGRIALSPAGAIETATVDIALGDGLLDLGPELEPVAVDGASLVAAFDAATGRIDLERMDIAAGGGSVSARGLVETVRRPDDGAVSGAMATLALGPVVLPLGALPARRTVPSARFDGGSLVIRVRRDPWRVEIAEAHLARGAAVFGLSGALTETEAGWSAGLRGRIRDLTVADLLALWPPDVAPGAKLWVREHMLGGLVTEGEAFVQGPLAAPDTSLSFAFQGASAAVLPPLPPIVEGRGWGSIDASGFSLTLHEGRVDVPGPTGGPIVLDGSSFRLDDLEADDAPAAITVLGRGPLPAILTLLAAEPLSLMDRVALGAGDVSGNGEARVSLVVPLLRDLLLEQVGVAAAARLSDVVVGGPLLPQPLSAASLDLVADTARMRIEGDARLGDIAMRIGWQETFAPDAETARTMLSLSAGLDGPALIRLGLPDGLGLRATSPIPVEATLRRDGPGLGPGETGFEATADLRGLAASVPALGWTKPAGAAGALRLAGVIGGAVRLDRLNLEAAGLRVQGRGRLGRNGSLSRLTLDRLAVGEGTDVAATVLREGEALAVSITGASLDAVPLLEGAVEADEAAGPPGPPFRVDLDVGRLTLRDGIALGTARATVARDAIGGLSASLSGALDGAQASVTLDRPAAADGRLRVTSDDAGGLLRGAGLFERGLGGRLDIEATLLRGGGMDGEARIADIVVSDDPGLDGLLAGADLDAALETLRRDGLRFETVRAPFRLRGRRLALIDAVAHGPVLGLAVSGDYDLENDMLDLEGVFTPLYGVNSLIGNLPLIGTLLTGGEGQGLIAFTFGLSGPASAPRTSVNPLSVLLPGVLRELIRPRAAPG